MTPGSYLATGLAGNCHFAVLSGCQSLTFSLVDSRAGGAQQLHGVPSKAHRQRTAG